MTQMPPDLSRPYSSDRERITDREDLLSYWYALKLLIDLASTPPDEWPTRKKNLVSSFASRSSMDPAARLQRWASLYHEELDLIGSIRDRIVQEGAIVTDPELLGATWLARQALAALGDISPNAVDQAWVRYVIAEAS
jgi:hypothetical protein